MEKKYLNLLKHEKELKVKVKFFLKEDEKE